MPPRRTQPIANRYQIIAPLGQGGMGIVYRARDRLRDQLVALKSISVASMRQEPGLTEGVRRFDPGTTAAQGKDVTERAVSMLQDDNTQRAVSQLSVGSGAHCVFVRGSEDSLSLRIALAQEFRTLASLRHPHIISVLDYGFDAERVPFFTMELLNDAVPILAAGRDRPLNEKMMLLFQVAQALAYLHRRGIVHRDLKPANLLAVSRAAGMHVKVLDFGLALGNTPEGAGPLPVAGTIMYMAPEVLRGEPPGLATDIYAFGVTAYELLAQQPPFEEASAAGLINRVLDTNPDLSRVEAPEPMRELLRKLMAKNPKKRLQDASELCARLAHAVGLQPPGESSSIRDSFLQAATFVARDAEVSLLMEALGDATSGHGSGWLVGGESGVGKSRLLDEVRTQALVRGANVLRGEATRMDGVPYAAFLDILRALCLHVDLDDAEARLLLPLLPDLPALLQREVAEPPPLEPKAAQERLLALITTLFARIKQPTVVLIEDVQWAGLEVILLLGRLMRTARNQPLVLLASYRDDEAPWLPSALPAMEVVKLSRFNRASISALSESMLGRMGRDPAIIDFLERETEGNAFFIVEILRSLAEERGMLSHIAGTSLPSGVFAGGMRAVIDRRLNRLPQPIRAFLHFAALAGRQLDLALLRRLEPGLDSLLETCANAAVLEVIEQQWRFTHEKLRERLIEEIPIEQQRQIHRQLAELITEISPSKELDPSRLAYHYGRAGDAVKTVHYSILAGEKALREGALEKAISHFQEALRWKEQLRPRPLLIVRAYRLASVVTLAMGHRVESTAMLRAAWALVGIPLPEHPPLLQPSEIGRLDEQVHEAADAVAQQIALYDSLHEAAMEVAELAASSMFTFWTSGSRSTAYFVCMIGLTIAEGFALTELVHHFTLCANYILRLTPVRSRLPLPSVTSKATNSQLDGISYRVSGMLKLVDCRWAAALADLQQSFVISEQLGDNANALFVQQQMVLIDCYQGKDQQAVVGAEVLIARAVSAGNLQFLAWGHALAALGLWRRGMHRMANAQLEIAARHLEKSEDTHCHMFVQGCQAALHHQLKKPQLALPLANKALTAALGQEFIGHEVFEGYANICQTYLLLLRDERDEGKRQLLHQSAERALELLMRFSEVFPLALPRTLYYRGVLAQMDRKSRRARALWRLAGRYAARLEMPHERPSAENALHTLETAQTDR